MEKSDGSRLGILLLKSGVSSSTMSSPTSCLAGLSPSSCFFFIRVRERNMLSPPSARVEEPIVKLIIVFLRLPDKRSLKDCQENTKRQQALSWCCLILSFQFRIRHFKISTIIITAQEEHFLPLSTCQSDTNEAEAAIIGNE